MFYAQFVRAKGVKMKFVIRDKYDNDAIILIIALAFIAFALLGFYDIILNIILKCVSR